MSIVSETFQDIGALAVVAAAFGYVVWRGWRRLRPSAGKGCGTCGSCPSASSQPPLVELRTIRQGD